VTTTKQAEVEMPEIQQADRERIVEHLTSLAEVVHKTWGVAECNGFTMAIDEIKRMTTTPPEPRALTAEVVMNMLPKTDDYEDHVTGRYGYITWNWWGGDKFVLLIGCESICLASWTTTRFAALIAAFGIGVGVKS